MKISITDARIKFGIINLRGKEYIKIPNLICNKHFLWCHIEANSEATEVEILCHECQKNEKSLSNL